MIFALHKHESVTDILVYFILALAPIFLPPPSSSGLSRSTDFECPASCIEFALVIYFICGNAYVSMMFSQIIPPLHSPDESKSLFFTSVSPLLPCM